MPTVLRSARVLIAALAASGCMTVDTRSNAGYEGPRTYSGARADLGIIGGAALSLNVPVVLLFAVDLPLCLVADTALLPITIPEERARRAGLEHVRSLEHEVPGPVDPIAGAPPEENAERLMSACESYLARLDPRAADCFAVDARVVTRDGATHTGAEYKRQLRRVLRDLHQSGGFLSYRDPEYTVTEQGVRVEATLASTLVEPTRVTFVVAPGADGDWRIIEAAVPRWPE